LKQNLFKIPPIPEIRTISTILSWILSEKKGRYNRNFNSFFFLLEEIIGCFPNETWIWPKIEFTPLQQTSDFSEPQGHISVLSILTINTLPEKGRQ